MSENARLGAIFGFFVLMGIGIWMLFSGNPEEPSTPQSVTQAVAPALIDDGMDARIDDDAFLTNWDEENTPELSTEVVVEEEVEFVVRGTVEGMKGPGSLKGVVSIDKGTIPASTVVALHYVPKEAEVDVSINTVLQTANPDAQGHYAFERIPMGNYTVIARADGYVGVSTTVIERENLNVTRNVRMRVSTAISGVVQSKDGIPILDAYVSLSKLEITTLDGELRKLSLPAVQRRAYAVAVDEEGRFTLDLRAFPEVDLAVTLITKAPGYPIAITENVSANTQDLVIEMEAGSNVYGKVIHTGTQEAIPKLELELDGQQMFGNPQAVTAEDGTFVFAGVASGTHHIAHSDEVLLWTVGTNEIEVAEGIDLADVVLEMNTGASLAGRVYDQDTDKSISGVNIRANPKNIQGGKSKIIATDARGEYHLEGLHEGEYQVEYMEIEGYSQSSRWKDHKNVFVVLAQATTGIDFPVSQGLTIRGIVVDPDGKPIEGANIQPNDNKNHNDYNKKTDKRGRFIVAGFIANSTVHLKAKKDEWAAAKLPVQIEDDHVVDVRIEMQTSAKISGIIVDTRGNPKANAGLFTYSSAESYGNSTKSAEDGTFTLSGMLGGTYLLKPMISNSYNSSSKTLPTVDVSAGEHVKGLRVVWDIEEGDMTISGRVTDDQGQPIQGVSVNTRGRQGGGNRSSQTDKNGQYELTALKEGRYRLSLDHQLHVKPSNNEIEAGSTNVDFTMARTGTITGHIVDAHTHEVVKDFKILLLNGNINYSPDRDREFKAIHHEEGFFTLEGAYPNAVRLMVRAKDYADTTTEVSGVRSGETLDNVTIALASGMRLTGVVLNEDAQPVKGAFIFVGWVPSNSWERDRGSRVSTNAQGEFSVEGLAAGENEIGAYSPGYLSASVFVNVSANMTPVKIVLGEGATVEGYVTHEGEPLANTSVSVNLRIANRQVSGQGTTDAEGFYRIKGLPAAYGTVHTSFGSNENRRSLSGQIETALGMVTEYNFDFPKANSRVEGYIMVSKTETSAGQVSLRVNTGVNTESRRQDVGDDGYYAFENLPAGRVTINAWGTSVSSRKKATAELGTDESLRLDLFLYGGATIQCSFLNVPDGYQKHVMVLPGEVNVPTPLSIKAIEDLSRISLQSASAGQDGIATISPLDPGQYTLVAVAFMRNGTEVDLESILVSTQFITANNDEVHTVTMSF